MSNVHDHQSRSRQAFASPPSSAQPMETFSGAQKLRSEIDDYVNGFGHLGSIIRAARQTLFAIPVGPDNAIVCFRPGSSDKANTTQFVTAFSGPHLCRIFANSHHAWKDAGSRAWRYIHVDGSSLLDELLPRFQNATTVMIDPNGTRPFTIPPTVDFMPLAPWAMDNLESDKAQDETNRWHP